MSLPWPRPNPQNSEPLEKPSAPVLLAGPFVKTVYFPPTTPDDTRNVASVLDPPTSTAASSSVSSDDEYIRARTTVCPRDCSVIQYSIHKPGRHLLRELELIFPQAKANSVLPSLLVIPLFQQSVYDLVAVSPETNWERDLLLEYINRWAKAVVMSVRRLGFWADLTDPASGYPNFSPRGGSLYPDVDGSVALLGYHTIQAGCCRVLVHPQWGTRNYPSTVFSAAPLDVMLKVAKEVSADLTASPLPEQ
ncbi:hypothetical protein HDU87_007723 [Geranomyces variabilis]|uniref:Methylmalonic aciduria and homocystinuria type D protein n=1 Tax=Geranomyces variabilis TaxID=109894 RepID=A0AAD5TJ53_9FUNG|nr:hypothetical protein HDU87_007723 [Geranomyces variabilis]